MKKYILFFILISSITSTLAQQKRTYFFAEPMFNFAVENRNFQPIGLGAGIIGQTQIVSNFSAVYGLEYNFFWTRKIAREFVVNDSFGHLAIPIGFRYKFNLNRAKKNFLNFTLGSKVLFQMIDKHDYIGNQSVGNQNNGNQNSDNEFTIEIKQKKGVFPLLYFGVGYEVSINRTFFMQIIGSYHVGFINSHRINVNDMLTITSKSNYFSLAVCIPINP